MCSASLTITAAQAEPWQLTVHADRPGAAINPGFYGLMTEEINHAFDGGLYAELLQNRSFNDDATKPVHWSLVEDGGGKGNISLDHANPLNEARTVSLRLEVTAGGGRVGAANDGFWGIAVQPDTTYQATFFARSAGTPGPITVALESSDGQRAHARASVAEVGPEWKKYSVALTTGRDTVASSDNRLVISAAQPGTVWLGFTSLFPPTYKNRANGNRIDLMEKLAALRPTFLRFPGGNYVDPGHYEWKKTLGPVESRPGSVGAWQYRISEGLGLLEFFEWCEDLGMEPVLAVTDGRPWLPANGDVSPLVQDALDEIEYATGAVETPWGARRAAGGHPAPFPLRFVEIGNEDFFDKQQTYEARFTAFFDAIRAKYPSLKIISTRQDLKGRVPDLIDDHIYASPARMLRASETYDAHSRSGPRIFVGEWAANGDGVPTSTLRSALGDAAYLTGLERNADLVKMACYAPLLVNVNPGARQWPTNLIGYNALHSFGSPSYHMQVMFSRNKGDVVLPVELSGSEAPAPVEPPHGRVGVGTYETQAEFKDLSVTHDGKTLFAGVPEKGAAGWVSHGGRWQNKGGALVQTAEGREVWAASGDPAWTDYTYKVKARKTGGSEGFLILFHALGNDDLAWWNVGGWGNQQSGLEQRVGGEKSSFGEPQDLKVETGRWYDLEIDVKGRQVRCSVDGKLVAEETRPTPASHPPIYASASRDQSTQEVILKVVNAAATPETVRFSVEGVGGIAAAAGGQVLVGQPDDVNTVAAPTKVSPQPLAITDAGKNFTHEFPAHSVSVFRLVPR